MQLVFVYGTLKRGHHNHSVLGNSRLVGNWTTEPKYKMYDLGSFPGVVYPGDKSIKGEIFEVNDETMVRLDNLEGYPHLYGRFMIETDYGPAYIYIFNMKSGRYYNEIAEGDWV